MADELYIDLLITDRDITLNAGNEPELCSNRVSIAQDIKHALKESGLPALLIAERSPTLRADIIMQMIILVEDDVRLVPGKVYINEEISTRLTILAETYEFGPIDAGIIYGN